MKKLALLGVVLIVLVGWRISHSTHTATTTKPAITPISIKPMETIQHQRPTKPTITDRRNDLALRKEAKNEEELRKLGVSVENGVGHAITTTSASTTEISR